jgi:HPt (histidine-containing phosphotransfer) domain-containing protein
MTESTNSSSNGQSSDSGKPTHLVAYDDSLQRLGGDKELFREFVAIFFEDSPELLEKLFTATQSSDHEAVTHSAHALKGLMLNFGATPCCELALDFELAGKRGELSSVEGSQQRLKDLYEQLCSELKNFL